MLATGAIEPAEPPPRVPPPITVAFGLRNNDYNEPWFPPVRQFPAGIAHDPFLLVGIQAAWNQTRRAAKTQDLARFSLASPRLTSSGLAWDWRYARVWKKSSLVYLLSLPGG